GEVGGLRHADVLPLDHVERLAGLRVPDLEDDFAGAGPDEQAASVGEAQPPQRAGVFPLAQVAAGAGVGEEDLAAGDPLYSCRRRAATRRARTELPLDLLPPFGYLPAASFPGSRPQWATRRGRPRHGIRPRARRVARVQWTSKAHRRAVAPDLRSGA